MQVKNKYRKGVFCILYHKGKSKNPEFLLLHRKLHWKGWEFCKGKMEKNEISLQTSKREIKEETGQKAEKITSLHHSGKYDYGKKFQKEIGFRGQTYSLFIAELKSRKISIDKREHDRYIWADYNQALKKLSFPEKIKSLKIAIKYLRKIKE
ncbi:MAG: NUDIX domain-containing protein [archaeon]